MRGALSVCVSNGVSVMDGKLCRKLSQRLVARDRGEGHLRLEGRSVIASRSLHRLAPLVRSPRRKCRLSKTTT